MLIERAINLYRKEYKNMYQHCEHSTSNSGSDNSELLVSMHASKVVTILSKMSFCTPLAHVQCSADVSHDT